MNMFKNAMAIAIVFLFGLAGADAYAHGGHQEGKEEKISAPTEPAPEPDIYSLPSKDTGETGAESGLDSLGLTEPAHETHMDTMDMKGMDMSGGTHAQHEKPQVKMSSHEWVSPSRKGYNTAVGITVFAGLVFGIMSLKRPNE
ncbi:MAG: hypothetical protein HY579_01230 [Nitrospinae bacterium]|nr:hypothetical protein [Nitrospinota bacterium]